ncbi:Diamine acetyltransferase 2 [Galdieria sulphuraria]|nr:Diamine acetyltransferase 2 [Galdieria sulphuraria]
MSKSQYRLRSAERSDVENILFMIKQLAEYEKEPHSVEITERDLERDGFETQPPLFHVVLAEVLEQNGWKCVGFALWFYVYSTVALSEKCKRYQWNVLTWNTPSIDFYEAVGAKAMKEWMLMRMDKYSMERFIESSTDSVSKQ